MSSRAAHWHEFRRDGATLRVQDFGGKGTPVVFLHGLAGHAASGPPLPRHYLAAFGRSHSINGGMPAASDALVT